MWFLAVQQIAAGHRSACHPTTGLTNSGLARQVGVRWAALFRPYSSFSAFLRILMTTLHLKFFVEFNTASVQISCTLWIPRSDDITYIKSAIATGCNIAYVKRAQKFFRTQAVGTGRGACKLTEPRITTKLEGCSAKFKFQSPRIQITEFKSKVLI